MSVELRRRLVRRLERMAAIHSPAVRDAFLSVPREIFVPRVVEDQGMEAVYRDEAIQTKSDAQGNAISSSSQPAIMAEMLEDLRVVPGQRILEIGSGTGYNAALLSSLVGPRGRVTSIELDPDVAATARSALRSSGHKARIVVGDGRAGWERAAPYDRIIVTASSLDVPSALADQVKQGGLVLIPLRLTDALPFRQVVVAFQRRADRLESVSVIRGGFMRLRDRVEDPSLPWPEFNVTETADGRERMVASLSGSTLGTLPDRAKRNLLAVMLTTPRSRRLGVRVSGWAQWDLEAFLALSAPEDRLVGCMREDLGGLMFMSTALPAIIDRDGNGLAYPAGRKTISRLDAHGGRASETALAWLVEEWRRRGRPDVSRLRIAVSYGSRRLTAWRLKSRGESTISFDWP